MTDKRRSLKRTDLNRLRSAEEFQDKREPDLRIGDVVTLNSGGPNMLVVDVEEPSHVTVAWRYGDGVAEHTYTRLCIHRVRGDW